MKKKLLIGLFIIGLIYVLLPGPGEIEDFKAVPGVKSDFPGDTIQNPNIAAFYTDYTRSEITKFYKDDFSKKLLFGIPLPIISLNHPPEAAHKYVRDQQESTFLEEYIFPLRESLFVNGYEPKVENDMFNRRDRSFIGDHLKYKEVFYNSKTTLRYHPSYLVNRVLVYLGIWLAATLLYKLFKKAWR